jgi:hypothetical protein
MAMSLSLFGHRFFKKQQLGQERYTRCEVRRRLRQVTASDERTKAVHAAAADVGSWTELLGKRTAQELGRSAERLPSAVFWYVQGRSLGEIGQRLRPLGGPWDAEYAIDVACTLIAEVLNERAAVGMADTARNAGSV